MLGYGSILLDYYLLPIDGKALIPAWQNNSNKATSRIFASFLGTVNFIFKGPALIRSCAHKGRWAESPLRRRGGGAGQEGQEGQDKVVTVGHAWGGRK